MEKRPDLQTHESKVKIVEQIKGCLHSGDYSRAMDLLRGTAREFPDGAELNGLEQLAHDGIKRKAEADRLITESQELFAQQNSSQAIQLLRRAYELDRNNSLARAILANALVEHANSIVETDWLEAEKLSNQALTLNPAHPTAKSIRNLIVDLKQTISVEDWVAKARKLQSAGDLFAALAWVAEGLAVHPDDPKLLQIQDAIQRDQNARRRQSRRRDLQDLRRMELEIDGAADVAAKQALAERIQVLAAKYWTDGEILSVANGLLRRLGLVAQESSTTSPHRKAGTVIFHVPRPSAPEPSRADAGQAPPSLVSAGDIPTRNTAASVVVSSEVSPSIAPQAKVAVTLPPPQPSAATQSVTVRIAEGTAPTVKVESPSSRPKRPRRSTKTLILVSGAAIIVVVVIFFFTRKHQTLPVANTTAPVVSGTAVPAPAVSTPAASGPEQTAPEASLPASPVSDNVARRVVPAEQPPAESGHNLSTLLVVTGQDDARVSVNGTIQRQLTQAGKLRLQNLAPRDYVVRVSKSGFLDPPQQTIRVRKGEQASVIFDLQPQPPHLASLTIQGGVSGATVLVDQAVVGTIQPDGTLFVSTINPGDHPVELRKERFKTKQFKKHFVAGETLTLAAADAALEAAPAELKITFTPADARVAIVKGEALTIVSSGVPLSVVAGTYTLTARTADGFTGSSTFEVVAGQSKTLDLSLAPGGMSKWDDPSAWKREKDSFICRGGNFVLYGVVPASGTFVFSAMLTKGHFLQWVVNYTDSKNYVLLQMDDNNFYRAVVRNGQKTDQIKVPDQGDKKSLRMLHIRVSPTEVVHQVKHGNSWTVLDRWTQAGTDLSLGKFGFYIPGDDQVTLSSFAHHAYLNIR